MKVGLGIVTCDRPDYFDQAMAGIDCLSDVVDELVLFSDFDHVGVAKAKNIVATALLDKDCELIFLSEDDVVVQSPMAVTGYVDAMAASGWQHLAFHAHGPANDGGPNAVRGKVTYWPNYVGAWCVYTRNCFEVAGLFDENFHNAWEHVEHTLRLAEYGLTPKWREAADATGSEEWIKEIPGSIENGVIRARPDWQANIQAGKEYWIANKPETARYVWPDEVTWPA